MIIQPNIFYLKNGLSHNLVLKIWGWYNEYLLFEMVFSASPLVVWQHLLFENGLSANLVLRIWGNNANIFYLKTGFPFFGACDGNLWKIIPISSIWKRDFRVFFVGLWWEPHLKTGFPCLFGLFWKIVPISSIWKRDFRCLIWLVMATSGK